MYERLTEFHGGIWGMSVQATKQGYDRYSVFSRLAAYEDSGLSPEQVRELAEAKAIYEAYDGSKLDKADQYIERLETVLEKAKEVLASVSYRSGLGSDEDGIREAIVAIDKIGGRKDGL